ncbi:TIGR01212 family radical SAM protein [bacterium]|nr:TIGR01212 family radical SAM protein [bacterium]
MADFQNRFLKESMQSDPYFTYTGFLKALTGGRVGKILVNAGFTCPNRDGSKGSGGCIYCDTRGSGTDLTGTIREQIESQLKRKASKYKSFILYFQAFTNTYNTTDKLFQLYSIIREYDEFTGMIIGTRGDCIDDEKLKMIDSFSDKYFVQLEYGLQTLDPDIRKWLNRNETLEEFENAVRMTKEYSRIFVGTHLILGLPGEKDGYHLTTADYLNRLAIDGIKLHSLFIPLSSPLSKLYKKEKFPLQTLEQFTFQASELINRLNDSIVIMRVGGYVDKIQLLEPQWCLERRRVIQTVKEKYAALKGARQRSDL